MEITKKRGDSFVVSLTLKNTGNGSGTWTVNVIFNGIATMWGGLPLRISLEPSQQQTFQWSGMVPDDASGVSQLYVDIDGTTYVQDWYINTSGVAGLSIISTGVY